MCRFAASVFHSPVAFFLASFSITSNDRSFDDVYCGVDYVHCEVNEKNSGCGG